MALCAQWENALGGRFVMSANLVRVGGGLAAMVGGALGIIASMMALVFVLPQVLAQLPNGAPSSGIITLTGLLLILAWVLVLGGLVGLYASQREAVGVLGLIGFVIALVGTGLLVGVLCVQTFYIPARGVSGVGSVVSLFAAVVVLVTSIGWFLFGLATFKARIYPRPAATLLMVGAAISAFIHLTGGEFIVMSVAIAWLGFFLFRGRSSSEEELARVG
jgi:hypothetical protein